MENLVISATRVEIDTERDRTFLVDVQMSEAVWEGILGQYKVEDIVRILGTRELLEHMDDEDIMSYLNDIGIKIEWEDKG